MADLSSLLGAAGIGGAIGKAIVGLELETTKYQAELKAAQAQTVASTNASSQAVGNFGKFASTALLGVGVAAVAGAAVSVKAAIEANEAHLKLQNTFANNERLSDSSVEAFERQADSLRDLTGVDDEAIISGQALLGQFRLTGDQVLELTPLIVDLSAKMGVDLEAAAKAVGKATEGNTGSLARYVGAIEAGATPLETFTNITEKLGRVQGFAAERAEAEPWRILGAQFEELAEVVGQAILPALIGLSEILIRLVPLVEAVGGAIALAFDSETYTDIPVIGEVFKALGTGIEHVGFALNQTGGSTETFTDTVQKTGKAISQTEKECREQARALAELGVEFIGAAKEARTFANMSTKELKEWSKDTTESFEDAILVLEETAHQTVITSKEFHHAHLVMEREARAFAKAMREIAGETWVNDNYIKFLSEQGPEWIIRFSKLTQDEQRKDQDAWKETTNKLDQAAHSQERMIGLLDKLDKSETKHKVTIEYDYVGFDPSKPGMADRVIGARS